MNSPEFVGNDVYEEEMMFENGQYLLLGYTRCVSLSVRRCLNFSAYEFWPLKLRLIYRPAFGQKRIGIAVASRPGGRVTHTRMMYKSD